jgi:formate hydrogenlyase subunit 3/multisubunit Na+/H+ antiporter MnhD subunit
MSLVVLFILLPFTGMLLLPFLKVNAKGIIAFALLVVNALISGYFAVQSLSGEIVGFTLPGSFVTGLIPVRIDALSGWFILIINLVYVTGGFYGLFYLKAYREQRNNLTLHGICFLFQHAAMIAICGIQNSFAFLVAWEIMALASFLLIIFEHEHISTIKAGINFLIQAHFSILFLVVGFIWIAYKTGSYDFGAITTYTSSQPTATSFMLFVIFFIGFSIKAGFVPFHTWLPYAHPASPSHVSGMMSGVIIKIGIFGILRMLLLVKTDMTSVGYMILLVSVVSGLYGVMLAIVQHNLKKLLAYHSIENIGIIGMGIGIGCVGIGTGNHVMAYLGFAGALLHTLNHSLFKSLLFYAAGNIYQATHTMDIEKLGGLIKRMPQTAVLFLIAAIAISGIPPFNGFISEFIIYTGLYNWMNGATLVSLLAAIFAITGLVLIGGFAMMCFTKAFGVVFLGTERSKLPSTCSEVPLVQLLPMYVLTGFIILIGLFPMYFIHLLSQPVTLFTGSAAAPVNLVHLNAFQALQPISLAAYLFIALVISIFMIRRYALNHRKTETGPTWGCGYIAPTAKQQYTAGSFVRTYSKLFASFLVIGKHEEEINGIFPSEGIYHTHPYDKIEKYLVDNPLKWNKSFMGRFVFLNNGKLQFYILYGVLFILAVLSIPFVYLNLLSFIDFLKHL